MYCKLLTMNALALLIALVFGQSTGADKKLNLDWRPKSGQILEYRIHIEIPMENDPCLVDAKLRVRVATSDGSNHSEVFDFHDAGGTLGDIDITLPDIRNVWLHQAPMKEEDAKRLGVFAWVPGLMTEQFADDEVALGSKWTFDNGGEINCEAIGIETVAGKPAIKLKVEARSEENKLIYRGTVWLAEADGSLLKARLDLPAAMMAGDEIPVPVLGLCTIERTGESVQPPLTVTADHLKAYRAFADFMTKSTGTASEAERNLDNFDVSFEEDDVAYFVKFIPKADAKALQTKEHPKGRTATGRFDKKTLALLVISWSDPD